MAGGFDILCVGQAGRLQYEAVLLAASLRAADPGFAGRFLVAEPQPGPLWPGDPRMDSAGARAALQRLGAEIVGLESRAFGAAYPNGNKIEALADRPAGRPVLLLDSDTLITGALSAAPFLPDRPTASMRRENTWPVPPLYGPTAEAIWRALYDRFGLPFAPTLDPDLPAWHWERYLYFNAGWVIAPDPAALGARWRAVATAIRDDPPEALAAQPLDPWLDQIALPLAIAGLGGGRPDPETRAALDGGVACHWRTLPLLYARADDRTVARLEEVAAPNWIKKVLKEYEPFRRMIYQGRGAKVRALFDRAALPPAERVLRQRIRAAGLWMR
jgi:hypothetical protein